MRRVPSGARRRAATTAVVAGSLTLLAVSPAPAATSRPEYVPLANQICASADAQAAQAFNDFRAKKEKTKKGKKRDNLRIRLSRQELEIGAAELAQLQAAAPATDTLVLAWLNARRELQEIDDKDHGLFKKSIRLDSRENTAKNAVRLRRLERKRDDLFLDSEPFKRADRNFGSELGAFQCVGSGVGGVS